MFDVIIVGGGSAGCALAARLSEDPSRRVALIEAGPDTPPGQEPADIRDPYFLAFFNARNFWPAMTAEFHASQNGRPAPSRFYEQARVMGGGSSVNAMIALRGLPDDFDEWVSLGAQNWAWADVLPYFIKLEKDLDFSGPLHGDSGPIIIRRHRRDQWPGFCQSMAEAAAARGWSAVADMNDRPMDGYCSVPMTNTATQRISTAMGYLTPTVRARANLRVMANTLATGLKIDGNRAVGIRARGPGGEEDLSAREVILSAGALRTPGLLQRAGVGAGPDLTEQGISVVRHLPGVGANLQDHPVTAIGAFLAGAGRQPRALRPAPNLALRFTSTTGEGRPSDIYVSVTNKSSWHALGASLGTAVISVVKPYSRGRVSLRSADPGVEARVELNLLSDARDRARMAAAFRTIHALLASAEAARVVKHCFPATYTERVRRLNRRSRVNWAISLAGKIALDGLPPLRRHLLDRFVFRGPPLEKLLADEDALRQWVGENCASFYHPVGTCRMGDAADPMAVVDHQCRVIGIEGLRIVDASVMPTIPRANTNLTTIMIAEKIAADMRRRV